MFKTKQRVDASIEERNVRLQHYLYFTENDLKMNKQGHISPSQHQFILAMQKKFHPAWAIVPIIILGIALLFIGYQFQQNGFFENPDETTILGLGGSLSLYIVILIYALTKAWQNRNVTPDQQRVEHLTGTLTNINTDMGQLSLSVGNQRINSMIQDAEKAFVLKTNYTFYYIKGMGNIKILLTAEAT